MLYRIGIDVGGTFTHAVALSSESNELVGKIKVATTHHSPIGVGEGVVQSLVSLMKNCRISSHEIALVAHSTTQATNSLLEGDVEKVGIISIGEGVSGFLTRRACRLGRVPLSPGKYLETISYHLSPNGDIDPFLEKCKQDSVRVLVIASAFSIEDPSRERAIAEYVRAKGFWATCTHEVSQLYGVRVRVRTTAINASILPKMLEVADHTEREIRKIGITAPLMIMRSDGGIMTIEEMRKKPILTLLSGPAAGIAAALRYLKITDGIFLEVGGTSTDISVIKGGRAITRSAVIGGNKTFLKTLDCRTLGVGGGSIPRVHGERVVDIGPRSAHIAQVKYAAFESNHPKLKSQSICPRPGDPSDYLIFTNGNDVKNEVRIGFTPTCAANLLGLVPDGDCAKATSSFSGQWSAHQKLASDILDKSSEKIEKTVNALIHEYKMERGWTRLVGGGGGASALVPHLAHRMKLPFEIARDNDVISAIGVALGMIREVIEKSCLNPTPEDIQHLRAEARNQVLKQGAAPESVEVFIEVDAKKNLIRAEAQGSIQFKGESQGKQSSSSELSPQQICEEVQTGFGLKTTPIYSGKAPSRGLIAHQLKTPHRRFTKKHSPVVVTDDRGVFRLKLRDATAIVTTVGSLTADLTLQLTLHTEYDDGGVSLPYVYVLVGERIVDLSKLHKPEQMRAVVEMEVAENPNTDPAALIFTRLMNLADE